MLSRAVKQSLRRIHIYPGAPTSEITSKLEFSPPTAISPTFRLTDLEGNFIDPTYECSNSDEELLRMYETMMLTHTTDTILYDAQRQGRISFYMMSRGEEAAQVGSAAAFTKDDVMYAQYRETGALIWRGFSIEQMAHQCFSNEHDLGKGRQMPVHYGSKALNIQTISSPLGTQLPQAAGAAYALRREGKGRCVVCYFGDGAASEGDFHAAMNFSSTIGCPVVFVCRNNGIAISTPTTQQYAGDGIVGLAKGYGMKTVRVDGNDVLAVYEASRMAKLYSVKEQKPVLIEAMTFRGGNHSTSDDSTRYRSVDEMRQWFELNNPITRFRSVLMHKGLWDGDREAQIQVSSRQRVLKALKAAEQAKKPPLDDLFDDVYESLTPALEEQKSKLKSHLSKFASEYDLNSHR